MDEIKRLLPDEGVSAAASVLDDVANLPSQTRLYEARLRFQRYEAARARASEAAGEEGFELGFERGELFGRIKTLQEYFGAVESTRAELSNYSDERLQALLEQLRDQLRNRNV